MFSSANTVITLCRTLLPHPWSTTIIPVRSKNYLNRPRLRNPVWFVKKTRTLHNEQFTEDNSAFLNEMKRETILKAANRSQSNLVKLANEDQLAEWSPGLKRTGVIAKKIGQYPMWTKNGQKIRTTLLQIIDNEVVKYIPPEDYRPAQEPRQSRNWRKPYGCLLVGAEHGDPSLFTKDYAGLFAHSGVLPKKHLCRFLISPEAQLPPGTALTVNHFRVGDFVDVRGLTVDRGFQGVVKRHGFKGMPKSHGVTKTHRRPGNIGAGGGKARVWPGTKMPGHMGNRWRVLRGLQILRINPQYNVLWVMGSNIAGSTNGIVYIYDTILPLRKHGAKGAPAGPPPFPTALEPSADPGDVWLEDLHDFRKLSITYSSSE
ncbi:large ribosomal subunit protein uL3 [Anopheles ziemanni]|uniref:large ribosomal subunit protein uL3 n=1 Tax=Anopheles coustani TaxID=139045 RepID=UPI0026592F80|nr:large ribosomal subunit protein uL3 [Anopheles coustani]XP_058175949.1 large ribosomal subunit protein uL3 [Anopheles ziemanni]